MIVQTSLPSKAWVKAGRLFDVCGWATLDALASWVWSLAGERACELFRLTLRTRDLSCAEQEK